MKKALLFFGLMCISCIAGAECLPRIDLQYTILASDTFNVGSFRFINNGDTVSLGMKVRHRGASSLRYDKPSYAIKLLDSVGQNFDASFLGMREDNYWILDAMAADKARMRNRVGMDLWLAFSRKPWYYEQEPKMVNGYRGKMVEVYVNDKPYGIYCLMERIDRKQLKLKKYSEKKGIQGTLYKSVNNVRSAAFYLPTLLPDNTSLTYDSWEVKYPDLEDEEPITWQPLYHLLQVVQRTKTNFSDTIADNLDIPVLTDYVLFCQLLSARDNDRKNVYLSFYQANSTKALYTPWDLDHSWGRKYNSTEELHTETLFENHQLYSRLNAYYHFQDTLRNRYIELRQNYFTIEYIDSLFANYFDLFTRTGMDTIEQQLWSGHNKIEFNIPSEQAYIHNWLDKRIAYLDSLYQYIPPTPPVPTQIIHPETNSRVQKVWTDNQFVIIRDNQRYDIYGRKIKDDE